MDIHGDGYMMYDIPVKTSIWDEVAMVAMKCHAKMIPFYSNGEQIGITWSIPEI